MNASQPMELNGMVLPDALVQAEKAGRWRPPDDAVLRAVFKDEPVQVSFYALKYMEFENKHWLAQDHPFYLGKRDLGTEPGDIDPSRSLLIGDLGTDMPFALDYRQSSTSPSVVYLHSKDSRWHLIAPSIEVLLELLHIGFPEVAP